MLVVHGRLGLGYAGSTSTSSASSSSSWSLRSLHTQRGSGHLACEFGIIVVVCLAFGHLFMACLS